MTNKKTKKLKNKESKKFINKKTSQIKNHCDFAEIINPFKDMSKEELKELVGTSFSEAKEKLPILINELIDLIKNVNPIHLLSGFVTSSLSPIDEKKGVSIQDSKIEIPQFYVEYVQAIFLTFSCDEINLEAKTTIEDFNKIKDVLDCIFSTNMLTRFDGGLELETDEEKSAFLMRSLIQGQTTAVRNWGYYTQVKKISLELYSHFSDGVKKIWF